MLTAKETHDYRNFAGRLADAAAKHTLGHFRGLARVEDKGEGRYDPVTVADRAAEAAMRQLIARQYPDHGIYGEEHMRTLGSSPYTWVLDPIDGTRSYIIGTPLWGTLIALNDGRQPILGVMDQPFTRERFEGDGKGSWLNGAALHTRSCSQLQQAILMCSTPDMFTTAEQQAAFSRVSRQARFVRFGGACYAYCMIAAGHVDAVIEAGLQPYDIQALIPIVEGAGGIVTTWEGGDAQHGGNIVACGDPRLHAEILAELRR